EARRVHRLAPDAASTRPHGTGAEVAMRDEWQSGDTGRTRGPAHDQRERRADPGMGGLDIAHRDRSPDRRAPAAARHPPDLAAVRVDDRRALAGRRRPVRADADAPARRSLGQLPQDDRRTGKTAFAATPLADRPAELGLNRGRRRVDVVAPEAE